jgi:hypothetical protein
MSKDRPTAAGMSPDELQAHQEAVEDALPDREPLLASRHDAQLTG